MNRGSEWRIWDLHVHTPLSIENNYGCANDEEGWNKYITNRMNNCEGDNLNYAKEYRKTE